MNTNLFYTRTGTSNLLHKAISVLLMLCLGLLTPSVFAVVQSEKAAEAASQAEKLAHPDPVLTPTGIKVNKKLPRFTPPSQGLHFSDQPSDTEIFQKSPFEEPLLPMNGTTTLAENKTLAAALVAFTKRTVRDDFSSLENFLGAHPQSPWREALLVNLGWLYRQTGWYSKAMATWQTAWDEGQKIKDASGQPLINRTLAELITLNARVGRMDVMEKLIPIADSRGLTGSTKEKVESAKAGLTLMKTSPQTSFRCGPMAVEKLRNLTDKSDPMLYAVKASVSTQQGTSLLSLKQLATKLKLDYIPAKRTPGAAILTPAVVNWKLGHYAALIETKNNLLRLRDPTFGQDVWVSEKALDAEASGYFLVKNEKLPVGWAAVSDTEAATIWGKGQTQGPDPDDDGPPGPGAPPPCGGGDPAGTPPAGSNGDGNASSNFAFFKTPNHRGLAAHTNGNGCGGDDDDDSPPGSGDDYDDGGGGSPCDDGGDDGDPGDPGDDGNPGDPGNPGHDNDSTPNNDNLNGPGYNGPPGIDMATYSVVKSMASLAVFDAPLHYTPAYGPRVNIRVTYEQREMNQPTSFTYTNFGPLWTCNWLSYITDDPTNPGADVKLYLAGGGTLPYTGYNSTTKTYAPQLQTRNTLKLTSSTSYEIDLADGSKRIFGLANNAMPRKVFLTQWITKTGNALTYSYDSNYRIVAVTDAMGQVTTLTYGLTTDIYKVTKVTDPFGRTALFAYTPDGYLASSTDMSGLSSIYGYTNGVLTSLTTPYGTTTFNVGQDSSKRWVQITDPQGALSRYEAWLVGNPAVQPETVVPPGVDNQYLLYRNTFYWSKKAMQVAPGNYTQAKIYHFLHSPDLSLTTNQLESVRNPLTSRVYFSYANQPQPIVIGSSGQVTKVQRVLDDGTVRTTNSTYNSIGHTTQHIDPAGRTTNYTYSADGIDLLTVSRVNPAAPSGSDLLVTYTYFPNHRVKTKTDPSGQVTSYTYTSVGKILTVTNAKNETTTYGYNSLNQLTSVTGPQTGATISFTYDAFGRKRTSTDIYKYTLTYDYDSLNRLTKVTYPDGTYEQRVYTNLSLTQSRDRQGRWTRYFYNSVRQLIAVIDSADRVTNYDRCTCGALKGLIDPLGHRTSWDQDIMGRTISKTYPDGGRILIGYYNNTSRIKTITDPKGQVKSFTYNADGTIANIAYTNATIPTPTVSYLYDPNYKRVSSMTDGTGTTTYAYNPVVAGTLGSGQLGTVTGPQGITSSIGLTYDQLGRVVGDSINGSANSSSVVIDNLGRANSMTNLLGTFAYGYVGVTPRLQSISSTNGPTTNFTWYPIANNANDLRIQEIANLKGSTGISKFDYTYNTVGTIASWQQQTDAATPTIWNYQYDAAYQLLAAVRSNTSTNAVLSNYVYGYDTAGNRTSEQVGLNVTSTTYNSDNQIVSRSGGGPVQFTGTISKPGTVTVNGIPAQVNPQTGSTNVYNFTGSTTLSPGTNTVPVVAQDFNGTTPTTNKFQFVMPTVTALGPAYDLNGNMTNDGLGKTFEWDAKDQMTAINYATPVQLKLAGTIIGTAGSYNNNGNTIAKAFDGNTATYFDGPTANGDWLGLDLGAGNTAPVTQIQYVPRASYASRMVGGIFQGSNTADFSSGVVTLATISSAPSYGTNVVSISGANAYRYVRYLAPNNGYGNIAELEFDSAVTRTQFTYDGLSRRVKIVELKGTTVVSTRQHLWVGNTIAEERDANNNVTKRFFAQGVQIGTNLYYYTRDHLGSVREVLSSSGAIQSRYDYDPYGRVTLVQGTNLADFQYAGYYEHGTSGLNLTKYRVYDVNTGRWLSRDPLSEIAGSNEYCYTNNDPACNKDNSGLFPVDVAAETNAASTAASFSASVVSADASLAFSVAAADASLADSVVATDAALAMALYNSAYNQYVLNEIAADLGIASGVLTVAAGAALVIPGAEPAAPFLAVAAGIFQIGSACAAHLALSAPPPPETND